jgi:hypothetical protein
VEYSSSLPCPQQLGIHVPFRNKSSSSAYYICIRSIILLLLLLLLLLCQLHIGIPGCRLPAAFFTKALFLSRTCHLPHPSHLPSFGSPDITWCRWVSGCIAGIAGSSPTEGMFSRPLRMLCTSMYWPPQLADPSFRGVLLVICVCVCISCCV